MGLDAYWILPEGVKAPVFDPELNLCNGWIDDENGTYSFGDYAITIFEVSGVSIRGDDHFISNRKVLKIARAFEHTTLQELMKRVPYEDVSEQEYEDLKRIFRAYADIGASLRISW